MKRTDPDYPFECFEKAHKQALHRYCKANGIKPEQVEGKRSTNRSVEYYHNDRLIMTAEIEYYIPKVKFKYTKP